MKAAKAMKGTKMTKGGLAEALAGEHGFDRQRALGLFALGLFNRNEFTWLD